MHPLKSSRILLSINRIISLLKNSSVKCKTKIILPINDFLLLWKEIITLKALYKFEILFHWTINAKGYDIAIMIPFIIIYASFPSGLA